jgi:hypothetical protein
MKSRRFAMLHRFMRAARLTLRPVFHFRSGRRGKGKSKGKATTGGRAFQLRKERNRSAKREAFLSRLRRVKTKATTPRPSARPSPRPFPHPK